MNEKTDTAKQKRIPQLRPRSFSGGNRQRRFNSDSNVARFIPRPPSNRNVGSESDDVSHNDSSTGTNNSRTSIITPRLKALSFQPGASPFLPSDEDISIQKKVRRGNRSRSNSVRSESGVENTAAKSSSFEEKKSSNDNEWGLRRGGRTRLTKSMSARTSYELKEAKTFPAAPRGFVNNATTTDSTFQKNLKFNVMHQGVYDDDLSTSSDSQNSLIRVHSDEYLSSRVEKGTISGPYPSNKMLPPRNAVAATNNRTPRHVKSKSADFANIVGNRDLKNFFANENTDNASIGSKPSMVFTVNNGLKASGSTTNYGATSNTSPIFNDDMTHDTFGENNVTQETFEYGKGTNNVLDEEDYRRDNDYQNREDDFTDPFGDFAERESQVVFSPFLPRNESLAKSRRTHISELNTDEYSDDFEKIIRKRSLLWKIHLIITDPTSSKIGWLCQLIIFIMIILSNIVLIIQTVDTFEHTPDSCNFCEMFKHNNTVVDNERFLSSYHERADCECPPIPQGWIQVTEHHVMIFFAFEWLLRLMTFDPPRDEGEPMKNPIRQLFDFFTEQNSIMDLLAFSPYFLEQYALNHYRGTTHQSLHYLRILRVFQLVRLGQHSDTFCKLVNVMLELQNAMGMLFIFILFGGAFFGTVIYWLEQGVWKYTDLIDPPGFAHVRMGSDGLTEELSPFRSIPGSMWWFVVTGKCVGKFLSFFLCYFI